MRVFIMPVSLEEARQERIDRNKASINPITHEDYIAALKNSNSPIYKQLMNECQNEILIAKIIDKIIIYQIQLSEMERKQYDKDLLRRELDIELAEQKQRYRPNQLTVIESKLDKMMEKVDSSNSMPVWQAFQSSEKRIVELKEEISTLKNNISTLKNDRDQLLKELEEDINNNIQKVQDFANKIENMPIGIAKKDAEGQIMLDAEGKPVMLLELSDERKKKFAEAVVEAYKEQASPVEAEKDSRNPESKKTENTSEQPPAQDDISKLRNEYSPPTPAPAPPAANKYIQACAITEMKLLGKLKELLDEEYEYRGKVKGDIRVKLDLKPSETYRSNRDLFLDIAANIYSKPPTWEKVYNMSADIHNMERQISVAEQQLQVEEAIQKKAEKKLRSLFGDDFKEIMKSMENKVEGENMTSRTPTPRPPGTDTGTH